MASSHLESTNLIVSLPCCFKSLLDFHDKVQIPHISPRVTTKQDFFSPLLSFSQLLLSCPLSSSSEVRAFHMLCLLPGIPTDSPNASTRLPLYLLHCLANSCLSCRPQPNITLKGSLTWHADWFSGLSSTPSVLLLLWHVCIFQMLSCHTAGHLFASLTIQQEPCPLWSHVSFAQPLADTWEILHNCWLWTWFSL